MMESRKWDIFQLTRFSSASVSSTHMVFFALKIFFASPMLEKFFPLLKNMQTNRTESDSFESGKKIL